MVKLRPLSSITWTCTSKIYIIKKKPILCKYLVSLFSPRGKKKVIIIFELLLFSSFLLLYFQFEGKEGLSEFDRLKTVLIVCIYSGASYLYSG